MAYGRERGGRKSRRGCSPTAKYFSLHAAQKEKKMNLFDIHSTHTKFSPRSPEEEGVTKGKGERL